MASSGFSSTAHPWDQLLAWPIAESCFGGSDAARWKTTSFLEEGEVWICHLDMGRCQFPGTFWFIRASDFALPVALSSTRVLQQTSGAGVALFFSFKLFQIYLTPLLLSQHNAKSLQGVKSKIQIPPPGTESL